MTLEMLLKVQQEEPLLWEAAMSRRMTYTMDLALATLVTSVLVDASRNTVRMRSASEIEALTNLARKWDVATLAGFDVAIKAIRAAADRPIASDTRKVS